MSWIDDALADYGRSIGLEPLTFNERGVLCLVFELSGTLFVERLDQGVLVYLCRELQRPNSAIYARSLDLCHWQRNHPYPVNAALRQDRLLVFAVRLSEEQVSVPTLEQVIQLLGQLHDQIQDGVPE